MYLVAYNLLSCAGWAVILLISVSHLVKVRLAHLDDLWSEIELPLKIVQTAAVLEVVHSMIGLVKSPWATALMQVFSRVWTVWAILDVAPPAQASVFMVLAVVSWSLVEIPRYLFYALNLLKAVPFPIFWLRYSLFAILYPTGISGELGCMYYAYLYLKNSDKYIWTPLVTAPQFKISLFILVVIVAITYIPGSPKMYMHMVKTRKKQFKEYRELNGLKKKE